MALQQILVEDPVVYRRSEASQDFVILRAFGTTTVITCISGSEDDYATCRTELYTDELLRVEGYVVADDLADFTVIAGAVVEIYLNGVFEANATWVSYDSATGYNYWVFDFTRYLDEGDYTITARFPRLRI